MRWITCSLLLLVLVPVAGAVETMPVDQVKAGMTGYGLSVFRGTKIERFRITVIGTLHKAFPGQDLILARCSRWSRNSFDIAQTGVISGMSGSPIYIAGKLIGALAYGWSFQREPICGITPIANMLQDMKRPLEKKMGRLAPRKVGGGLLRACRTPLVISGASSRAMAYARRVFRDYNLLPVKGGAAGQGMRPAELRKLIRPGGALAVQLVDGDVDFSAIGTITHVDGDQLIAFGHPFFQAGEIDMPIAAAQVDTVINSMSGSFKLGSPLGTVGRLVSDRQASVVGKLGRTSRMIPVKVSVKNRQTGVAQRYACRVLTHDLLTPMLLNMSLMSFLDAAEPSFGWNTKQIAVTVSLANGKKVTVRDVAVGQSSTFSSLMTSVFSQLWRNPFRRVRIERIDLDVAVEQVDRSAYLLRVLREMQEARPGETLGLRVVLRRFDKRDITIPVTFKLPEELAPGKYTIEIGGGDIYQPSLPAPRNLDEIIQLIGHWERADTLVVWMRLPRLDVRLKGKTMQKVPASVLGTLLPANRGGELALTQAIHRSTTKTDYVLSGKLSFRIEVKKGADK